MEVYGFELENLMKAPHCTNFWSLKLGEFRLMNLCCTKNVCMWNERVECVDGRQKSKAGTVASKSYEKVLSSVLNNDEYWAKRM